MSDVPRLDHVILYVSDLEASVRFNRDAVGLEHRFTDAGYAEFGTATPASPATSGGAPTG